MVQFSTTIMPLCLFLSLSGCGNDASADLLRERMKKHIHTIVSRYKGRIKGWDVVNEAIEDNGEFRKSKFYQILGEDFISLAFQYAHEADPDAELYYNDYNEWQEGKREAIVRLVKNLKETCSFITAIRSVVLPYGE